MIAAVPERSGLYARHVKAKEIVIFRALPKKLLLPNSSTPREALPRKTSPIDHTSITFIPRPGRTGSLVIIQEQRTQTPKAENPASQWSLSSSATSRSLVNARRTSSSISHVGIVNFLDVGPCGRRTVEIVENRVCLESRVESDDLHAVWHELGDDFVDGAQETQVVLSIGLERFVVLLSSFEVAR